MRAEYKNPAIHKAFDYLEMLSADDKNRYLAEIREKALKNERSELSAAERKGFKKGFRLGLLEAIEALLSARFGDEGSEMMPLIRHIQDCDRLRAIKDAIRNARDFAEMKAIIGN